MLNKCRQSVNAARQTRNLPPLTDAQVKAIDDRLSQTMRRIARRDVQSWQSMSHDQRVIKAAQEAAADVAAEAARKVRNASMQIIKTADTEQRIADSMARQPEWSRARALVEDMGRTSAYIDGIKRDNVRNLMALLEAADSKAGASLGRKALMVLFDAQNPAMTRDLALEVYAKGNAGTGNVQAVAGAKAWLEVTDAMRKRFNAAGGDVGQLDYGYLPQAHDQTRVLAAKQDGWADATLPLLDRSRYLNEDGSRMTDDQVRDLLRGAWETISSDGANKSAPGAFKGSGARANRGSESREIHFKDGAAYLEYLRRFGMGSMYDAMVGHIGGLSRDIGMVERYGPNPEAQMRVQFDKYKRADGDRTFAGQVAEAAAGPRAQWAVLSGAAGMSGQYAKPANVMQHVRNIETFGKLQGAVLSSITDLGTYFVTAGFNRLSYWKALANIGKMAGKSAGEALTGGRLVTNSDREFLNAHGFIAESMISDLNRWAGENIAQSWSGRVANATMRMSLMNAWTDTLRRAFSMTMMQAAGRMAKTDWPALSEWDRFRLASHDITEADWTVIRQAQPVAHNGADFVTPDAIYAVQDADILAASPGGADRIRMEVQAQTADLMARNAQEAQWISGRIDKFDDARDAMNRWVKARQAKRLDKNQEATGPMLERMALLDAQREQAQLHADMEADFNRFSTQYEVRAFLNSVEDGASADKTDTGAARPTLRAGLESAERIGRRYGESKGRLERRMVEIESRIAEMDRAATRATDEDAKAAQKKAEAMAADLADFIKRAQSRIQARQAVVQRIQGQEAARLAEEAQRIRGEVAAKFIAYITDESEIAVLNPDLTTRAIVSGGGMQRGTIGGEAARAVAQFKSFPIAMIARHWRRMLDAPQDLEGAPLLANRLAYAGAMMVSLTALGAIAFQTKQIVSGKDPVDMTTPKFWTRALAQGGGLGFVGDMILTDTADDRSPLDTFGRSFMGPTYGSAAELYELTKGNIDEAMAGKQTHAGAEAVRFARSHLPLTNLWYAKAALDHAALHSLQESLSPGYLSRIRSKQRKDWGGDWWWQPGSGLPDRAPSFEQLAGGN